MGTWWPGAVGASSPLPPSLPDLTKFLAFYLWTVTPVTGPHSRTVPRTQPGPAHTTDSLPCPQRWPEPAGTVPGARLPHTLFGRGHFIPSPPHLGTQLVPICNLRPTWGLGWGFFEVGGRLTVVGLGLFFFLILNSLLVGFYWGT